MLVYCKKSCRVCGKSPQKINHIKWLSFSKSRYNQTPLYGHRLKRTPHQYRQFSLSLGKAQVCVTTIVTVTLTVRSLKTRKGEKNVLALLAKNRRVWTASFTLVDQWLDPGSPGGFRQTHGQFPKEIFGHFNIPTWRQASALLSAL